MERKIARLVGSGTVAVARLKSASESVANSLRLTLVPICRCQVRKSSPSHVAVAVGIALFQRRIGAQADVGQESIRVGPIDHAVQIEIGVGSDVSQGVDLVVEEIAALRMVGAEQVQQPAALHRQQLERLVLLIDTFEEQATRLTRVECAAQFLQVDEPSKRNRGRVDGRMIVQRDHADVFKLGEWDVRGGRRASDCKAGDSVFVAGDDVEFAEQIIFEVDAGEAAGLLERAVAGDEAEAVNDVGMFGRRVARRTRRPKEP